MFIPVPGVCDYRQVEAHHGQDHKQNARRYHGYASSGKLAWSWSHYWHDLRHVHKLGAYSHIIKRMDFTLFAVKRQLHDHWVGFYLCILGCGHQSDQPVRGVEIVTVENSRTSACQTGYI